MELIFIGKTKIGKKGNNGYRLVGNSESELIFLTEPNYIPVQFTIKYTGIDCDTLEPYKRYKLIDEEFIEIENSKKRIDQIKIKEMKAYLERKEEVVFDIDKIKEEIIIEKKLGNEYLFYALILVLIGIITPVGLLYIPQYFKKLGYSEEKSALIGIIIGGIILGIILCIYIGYRLKLRKKYNDMYKEE